MSKRLFPCGSMIPSWLQNLRVALKCSGKNRDEQRLKMQKFQDFQRNIVTV